MQASHVELQLGRNTLTLETGKLAKQAHGAVVARYGDTVVLVTAVEGRADPTKGWFPLVVDYRERMSAGGKFPGGFIKREGRPSTKDTLTSRLIDRPIRPLFPAGYINEVQILGSVLAADKENDPDVLAMIARQRRPARLAHPVHPGDRGRPRRPGQRRIRRHADASQDLEESDLDLIVAGTRKAVTMIEGFSREMAEDDMLAAIEPASDKVPSPLKANGYIAGADGHLTYAEDVHKYMRALEAASPRVKVFSIGKSEEGREMILVAISSEKTIANLNHYRDITKRLSDPRTLPRGRRPEAARRGQADVLPHRHHPLARDRQSGDADGARLSAGG